MKTYTAPVLSVLLIENGDIVTLSTQAADDCAYTPWDEIWG